jgi:hypothetical protein
MTVLRGVVRGVGETSALAMLSGLYSDRTAKMAVLRVRARRPRSQGLSLHEGFGEVEVAPRLLHH